MSERGWQILCLIRCKYIKIYIYRFTLYLLLWHGVMVSVGNTYGEHGQILEWQLLSLTLPNSRVCWTTKVAAAKQHDRHMTFIQRVNWTQHTHVYWSADNTNTHIDVSKYCGVAMTQPRTVTIKYTFAQCQRWRDHWNKTKHKSQAPQWCWHVSQNTNKNNNQCNYIHKQSQRKKQKRCVTIH